MKEDSKAFREGLHYKQLIQFLDGLYKNQSEIDISRLIEQIRIVEKFSIDNNRILCLFSNPDFYFKYISKNVEAVIGYTPEEIYKGGLAFGYKLAYWKQLSLPIKIFQWGERFAELLRNVNSFEDGHSFFCGVKMKDKQGNLKTFFIKQKILVYGEDKWPLLSFMEIEDITDIYKRDFVWARFRVKYRNDTYTRAFLSQGQKKEYADLLSNRELEVLRLVAQQKNSLEISEVLGISKNTVERHRKNMIARTGVVDMTSLLYVSRLCHLI